MANRFWVGGTGTWDASDTTHWAATSGGAGGVSVPTSGDAVTLDGSSGGGTVTVNTNFNLGATGTLTMDTFTGTLDFATNNNSPSMRVFSSNGSATRTLNMGNGTWTMLNPGGGFESVWNAFSASNFTMNANSSTLLLQPASVTGYRAINANGATFNNITVNNPTVSYEPIVINIFTLGLTCANLTLNNVRTVWWDRGGTTVTITGALTWAGGTGITDMASIINDNDGTPNTLNVANATTINWLALQGIIKTGAGSIVANNSIDLGRNSGITINAPAIGGSSTPPSLGSMMMQSGGVVRRNRVLAM